MLALSENIRRLRRARGLSQEELAHRLKVSRQSVSLWEQGVTHPTVENIYAMAEVLETSFDELMAPPASEAVAETIPAARSFDELLEVSDGGTSASGAPVNAIPTPTFYTAPEKPSPMEAAQTPPPAASHALTSEDADRRMRAEAQYYRYRRLVRGTWIGTWITVGSFVLFIFSVVVLGEFAARYPDSVINNVVGPALMLVSILLFLCGLITLIVMAIRSGAHRRRMGDLFDLATYEELKRGGRDYATRRRHE